MEDDFVRTFGNLSIQAMVLGPVQTNTYLLTDTTSRAAVVIDPAWDGARILQAAQAMSSKVTAVWLTHAHFDHLGGTRQLMDAMKSDVPVALHPEQHLGPRDQVGRHREEREVRSEQRGQRDVGARLCGDVHARAVQLGHLPARSHTDVLPDTTRVTSGLVVGRVW